MTVSADRAQARGEMVERQLVRRGIRDERVLEAMREVPREAFVPPDMGEFAYEDSPLPIGSEQTISQPYVVASMIELAAIEPGDRVLEIGSGSGYAAAVMSRIAARVYGVERQGELAMRSRHALRDLGYDNVQIVHADGLQGLPEYAPFDAIIVSAGGELPEALKSQLAIGGRLVIPLEADGYQVLTTLHRRSQTQYERDEHGAVRFVPLLPATAGSEHGPGDGDSVGAARVQSGADSAASPVSATARAMAANAEPFDEHESLARLVAERYADRRVVCLGEATHGTGEFYAARAAITERLVRDHGFRIVAVEADWPDAAYYDRAIRRDFRGRPAAEPFVRFPRWMWRNRETWDLLKALKAINDERSEARQTGFYGLDVYSLQESIGVVLDYLESADPDAAAAARERYACLTPWCADPAAYGRMRIDDGFRRCEDHVAAVLTDMLARRLADGDEVFDAEQNARIVVEAERYYRVMYYGGAAAWNLRDQHMFDTLERLLAHHGDDAKAVVWAHNSHVGDARATDMGRVRGEHNIGQLIRERHGGEAALIGFATGTGEVAAADDWGGRMQVKAVRPPLSGSIERDAVQTRLDRFFLGTDRLHGEDRRLLDGSALQRAIGVVYRPETERWSHYFESQLASQYDAWVWFAHTGAVHTGSAAPGGGERELFPFGL